MVVYNDRKQLVKNIYCSDGGFAKLSPRNPQSDGPSILVWKSNPSMVGKGCLWQPVVDYLRDSEGIPVGEYLPTPDTRPPTTPRPNIGSPQIRSRTNITLPLWRGDLCLLRADEMEFVKDFHIDYPWQWEYRWHFVLTISHFDSQDSVGFICQLQELD